MSRSPQKDVTQRRRPVHPVGVPLRLIPVQLRLDLLGSPATVTVRVYASWETVVDLEIEGDGRSRLFSIASWHPRGMKAFCLVFHWHRTRDELTFGSVREINGQPHLLVDENQMGCLIMQAVQDVVAFVNTVFRKHHREMRDYAVWYLSSQPSEDASDYSYSDVIMRTACRLIVDCNLIAPNVQWKIVEFCNDNASSSSSSMTTADMASLMSKLHLSTGDVQDW